MLMATFMMASGKMTRLMEWVTICMQMELPITENGKTTNNTAKVQRRGQMERGMKVLILKERSMEKVLYALQMEASIQETFSLMRFQEEESTCGLMENHMKGNGKRIKCMATEY